MPPARAIIASCGLSLVMMGCATGEGPCGDPSVLDAYKFCLKGRVTGKGTTDALSFLEEEGFSRTRRDDGVLSLIKRYDGIYNRTIMLRLDADDGGVVRGVEFGPG